VADVKGRRPYRSAVREEGARRTRRAVVAAATELFTGRGYAATSLADVATAAGVARPTVFAAFGSKAALLRQVLDQAIAGDDEPVPVADRPWFRPVWDAQDAGAVLDAYAAVCTLIGRRAGRAFEAVRRAADAAPEVAELWETLLANRVAGARMVIGQLVTVGALRDGLTVERAVDVLWFFNDPAHHRSLVGHQGWPEAEFQGWLAGQMRAALLG
jgi:AcrR family transcriptional regulator